MPLPDAIVFDLDGTLVDSAPDIGAAVSAALVEAGGPGVELADVRRFIGDGARALVDRALAHTGGPGDVDAVLARFLPLYLERVCVETRLYPGARALVEGLAAAGVRLAICTNKPMAHTRALLDALAIGAFFPVVIGGDSQPERKPHPAPLRRALAGLGVDRGLLVGDSDTDVQTARAAGQPVVLLRHGYSRVPVEGLSADATADGFLDLPLVLARFGLPAPMMDD